MNEIEKIIKEYIYQYIKFLEEYKNTNIQKIFFYSGYEILPFTHTFLMINNQITGAAPRYFPKLNSEIFSKYFGEYDENIIRIIEHKVSKLKHPPTHIKATYDVELNITTFEYIYDKILDEENEDDFSSKMFYEWQYQLGKPRPVPINVPDGYHIEYRSTPINQYDKKGKLISIQTELKAVVVKDGE